MTGMLGEQLIAAKEKLEDTRDMATEAHSIALEEARAEVLQVGYWWIFGLRDSGFGGCGGRRIRKLRHMTCCLKRRIGCLSCVISFIFSQHCE
jgi:hypothetical protein